MTYSEAIHNVDIFLLSRITELYDIEGYDINLIKEHEYGQNIVYTCEKKSSEPFIIRISYKMNRSREHLLAELEFVRYLYENDCCVSNVINSRRENLLEEIVYENHSYFVTLFAKAVGKMLVDNNYQYRENVPLKEYFFNCGKTLGKIHAVSKTYKPIHCRYSFFDKYNSEIINQLIPDSLFLLKQKLKMILKEAEGLDMGVESFGLIHSDYSDSNYHINFENGDITVYDFDNSCYCWYMFDLAKLWTHGVGWIQYEEDAIKRKEFMDNYFEVILNGYRSETSLNEKMLEKMQLFIRLCYLEKIVNEFEKYGNNYQKYEQDEWLSYNIKCILDDIPYIGFFHLIYSTESPFMFEMIKNPVQDTDEGN